MLLTVLGRFTLQNTLRREEGIRWEYIVDFEAMTQRRIWNGNPQGKERQLRQVEMIELGNILSPWSIPGDILEGYVLHWQYLGQDGWKNFAPVENVKVTQAFLWVTMEIECGPMEIDVSHSWLNHRHNCVESRQYTVDFISMTQRSNNAKPTTNELRLVAFKSEELYSPTAPSQHC